MVSERRGSLAQIVGNGHSFCMILDAYSGHRKLIRAEVAVLFLSKLVFNGGVLSYESEGPQKKKGCANIATRV